MNLETISNNRQLLHDIRSPLAVLTVLMQELNSVPDEMRDLLSTAVNRINEIINEQQTLIRKTVIPEIVKSVVKEKRYEYKTKPIQIECHIEPEVYLTPVRINVSDFKRILSNLINNSVEAMDGNGNMTVSIFSRTDDPTSQRSDDLDKLTLEHRGVGATAQLISIEITDTGQGIPPEVLPKLMNKGATFGKEKGQGLGLYHAKKCIEGWGGKISICSEEGKGTRVEMVLI
ncbi:MAG: HAMP domain-containing sensor histidine kinase [bacterium]|nr:HAMP domain-containing histidine kinase [bacterium]